MRTRIEQGVHRFQNHTFSAHAEHFAGLAQGQSPLAMFITCSDSRINPNLITHTQPGELFVVRNAGNIVPPSGSADGGEAATLEYAVKVLEVPEIVLCGHSRCGAMTAVLDPSIAADLPCVCRWLEHARAALDRTPGVAEDRLHALIEQNVALQVENLRTFDFVRKAEQAGRLRLSGWVYRFETGEFFELDHGRGVFAPITAGPRAGS